MSSSFMVVALKPLEDTYICVKCKDAQWYCLTILNTNNDDYRVHLEYSE